MKNLRITAIVLSFLITSTLFAEEIKIEKNDWLISFDATSKTFDYNYKGKLIFDEAYPEAKYDIAELEDVTATPSSHTVVEQTSKSLSDNFGNGTLYTIRFSEEGNPVSLEQDFYFYDDFPYFLTALRLEGDADLASNYLAPIVSTTSVPLLERSSNNRMLWVPWDNDSFDRYKCYSLSREITSHEVTSIYQGDDYNGLVIGSVEHDTWKSAVNVRTSGNQNLNSIRCFSGVSSELTRDKIPHGKVKGTSVKSAKMLVGFFDDWRLGMEAYGHANTLIVPARETWKRGTPVGWNSWGVLAEKITFQTVTDVSNFFKEHMFDIGYHNEQDNVIIDLDSFWDNLSAYDRQRFAANCKKNGQIPGIYWCPFSYWGGNLDSYVEGTNNQYRYRDCVLYVNGSPHSQGGYCVDPTHPAIKQRTIAQFNQFKNWGYEYVKLDFVTNGAIQADSYYDESITTGVQAYNKGFQDVLDAAGDDMFIALSIAPIFPYQYGNSRRISCDAWGTIGHTEYVMNCLSFGWWTDQIYQYNDPDHIVLQTTNDNESEKANRARITSGIAAGMVLLGDNFSDRSDRGKPAVSRERAVSLFSNSDICEAIRIGISFKPVYGWKASESGAENFFMLHTPEYLYVAGINYRTALSSISTTIPLDLLEIEADNIESIKELWTGQNVELKNGELPCVIAASEAVIYRFTKKDGQTGMVKPNQIIDEVKVSFASGQLALHSPKAMQSVSLYDMQGCIIKAEPANSLLNVKLDVASVPPGAYVLKVNFADQSSENKKIVI